MPDIETLVKHIADLTERIQLLERTQIVALDPTKFNVMIVRFPDTASFGDIHAAIQVTDQVREQCGLAVRIVVPDWYHVEFAVQE